MRPMRPMRPATLLRDPRALLAAVIGVLGLFDLSIGAAVPHTAPVVVVSLLILGYPLGVVASGLVLLALSWGLARGLRAAWFLTLVLLLQVAIRPTAHDERTLLILLPAAVLWLRRSHFAVRARAPWRGGAVILAGLAFVAVAGLGVHQASNGHSYRHYFAYVVRAADSDEFPMMTRKMGTKRVRTHDPGRGPAWPLALAGLGLLLVGLRGLTLPGAPRCGADRRTRALARRLFATYGTNGVGYFAAADDKAVWLDPQDRGIVAFRLIGATALVAGDPLAAPADLPTVLDRFLAYCHAQGWTPAFYQTLGRTLSLYRAHDFHALAIGREAIIDLPAFTLSGKKIANVRHSVTHAERAGLSVRLYEVGQPDDAVRADLVAVSREWLAAKGNKGEMGFTMGQLSADGTPTPGARVAIAYGTDGQAQAFLTVVPAGGGRGWTLDVMRRRHDAVSGTMDLLIARTAEALRDEGYATLSLSLAPLASSDDDDEDAPMLARRARALLYERMDGAYNYRSLFNYKKKFNVRWETRYLVYAGHVHLPAAIYATARAHLPGALIALPSLPVWRPGRHAGAGQRSREEQTA